MQGSPSTPPPARLAEQTPSPSLQQVFTRIGCARVILARSSANPLNHQTTSKLQTAVVLEAFAKAHQEMREASSPVRARVQSLVMQCKFEDDDLRNIFAVVEATAPVPRKSKRPNQVFFPSIFDYFTAAEWKGFEGRGITDAIELLTTCLLDFGGVNISE